MLLYWLPFWNTLLSKLVAAMKHNCIYFQISCTILLFTVSLSVHVVSACFQPLKLLCCYALSYSMYFYTQSVSFLLTLSIFYSKKLTTSSGCLSLKIYNYAWIVREFHHHIATIIHLNPTIHSLLIGNQILDIQTNHCFLACKGSKHLWLLFPIYWRHHSHIRWVSLIHQTDANYAQVIENTLIIPFQILIL